MALTATPAAGAKLRGSVLEALMDERTPIYAKMTGDQALATGSTALQNLTELVAPVEANAEYEFTVGLGWVLATGTTEDIKFALSFPTGATVDFGGTGPAVALAAATHEGDAATARRVGVTSATTTIPYGASTSTPGALWTIRIANGSNAGNLQIMAAQNTGGGNVVTVKAGSYMLGRRVS